MKANEQKLYQIVYDSLHAVTGVSHDRLNPQTKLISDLNIESIDAVDVLFEVEKKLGVSINLADVFQSKRRESGQSNQFDLEIQEIVQYIVGLEHNA